MLPMHQLQEYLVRDVRFQALNELDWTAVVWIYHAVDWESPVQLLYNICGLKAFGRPLPCMYLPCVSTKNLLVT